MRLKPSGTKTILIQYRNAERRTRRFVIGQFGVLTVDVARDCARKKLASVIDGGDPSEERRAARDVERLQADIASGKSARGRKPSRGGKTEGGIGVAGRAISTLRSLLSHARRHGLIEQSPANGVRVLASEKLKRRLNAGEIRHLGKIMTQMEREGEHPTGIAAIRALLLTGFRRMEVLAMRKEWRSRRRTASAFPTPSRAHRCGRPEMPRSPICSATASGAHRPLSSPPTGETDTSSVSCGFWTACARGPGWRVSRPTPCVIRLRVLRLPWASAN